MTPGVTEILRTAATALTAARAATRVTREPSTGGRGDDGAPAGQHLILPGVRGPGFSGHTPDLAALRAESTTISPCVGRDSAGETPQQDALAGRLGINAVVLPGGHGGS